MNESNAFHCHELGRQVWGGRTVDPKFRHLGLGAPSRWCLSLGSIRRPAVLVSLFFSLAYPGSGNLTIAVDYDRTLLSLSKRAYGRI
jgi:hypothetical protein